jgi:hypothetical protein
MPVTAKFSKAFYQKLGHAVADELVNWVNQVDTAYRSELRELNELNFARFDAKLEQRIVEVKAEMREATSILREEMRAFEARLTRWMFVFWAGSMATILGTLVALLKL